MALKISLRPGERMIVGGAVVCNGSAGVCHLIVENKVPVLRQRDIMGEAEATTLRRRIYFAIQLIYIDQQTPAPHVAAYWELVKDLLSREPEQAGALDRISAQVLAGRYYEALKLAAKLMKTETERGSD
jgi:flagellar protein FlbT